MNRAQSTLSLVLRKSRNFIRRPLFEIAWFAPAWALLGICRFVILAVHFRRLAPLLGIQTGVASWVPLLSHADESRARMIGRAIALASRHTPWDSNCFAQALAARIMLGIYRVPYCLYFGIDSESGSMQAHAWVATGRIAVTGGTGFGEYTVVGIFAAPALFARGAHP